MELAAYDIKLEGSPEFCPHCNSDQKDLPIPEKQRKWFGGMKWFKRTVNIYSAIQDRGSHFMCPDCEREI